MKGPPWPYDTNTGGGRGRFPHLRTSKGSPRERGSEGTRGCHKMGELHSIFLLHGTSKQGYNGSPEKASWGVIETPGREGLCFERMWIVLSRGLGSEETGTPFFFEIL